jgi:hypothetical protein
MASSTRSTIFRVTGLPCDEAVDVKSALAKTVQDLLTEDEKERLQVEIECIPACDESPTSNALIEFKGGNPGFLSALDHNPLGDWQVEMGDEDINIDRHFFGFTQMYPTASDRPVTAEYVLL